jgi:hypothetical protein
MTGATTPAITDTTSKIAPRAQIVLVGPGKIPLVVMGQRCHPTLFNRMMNVKKHPGSAGGDAAVPFV